MDGRTDGQTDGRKETDTEVLFFQQNSINSISLHFVSDMKTKRISRRAQIVKSIIIFPKDLSRISKSFVSVICTCHN